MPPTAWSRAAGASAACCRAGPGTSATTRCGGTACRAPTAGRPTTTAGPAPRPTRTRAGAAPSPSAGANERLRSLISIAVVGCLLLNGDVQFKSWRESSIMYAVGRQPLLVLCGGCVCVCSVLGFLPSINKNQISLLCTLLLSLVLQLLILQYL
jgi:hypothetical protein